MVVGLDVGLRLVKGNFVLSWVSLTNYQYHVYAINSIYTRYMLVIDYY